MEPVEIAFIYKVAAASSSLKEQESLCSLQYRALHLTGATHLITQEQDKTVLPMDLH